MYKDIKEYQRENVEAVCSICGAKKTIRKYSYNYNVRHNGRYICHSCSLKEYSKTSFFTFDVAYNYPDEIKRKKAAKKLKKNNIVLLDYIKDKRGLFPSVKVPDKTLKLKCLKCGNVWWGSPRVYLDKNGKCPVCVEVKVQKYIMEIKKNK